MVMDDAIRTNTSSVCDTLSRIQTHTLRTHTYLRTYSSHTHPAHFAYTHTHTQPRTYTYILAHGRTHMTVIRVLNTAPISSDKTLHFVFAATPAAELLHQRFISDPNIYIAFLFPPKYADCCSRLSFAFI